ncbi:DHA2 family efflux MFS transporter permease subunit [Allopusillimonas soli]|uniref:DHA2 family efflux MFS transporter permease subunit n=1 Tax=Allopusillimonas soli TaxID=659016 RepID=A0A853F6W0_9BURK|nr:DHA2 family efflux MFS transporter permease subunit [Allopusillimonas soli]NYT35568.1 DHA2 family efflux MFS transporter permease subunit [Allopusillimonas soli]TEA75971.1 DHA2 family efflux MFS transporter permease subunit [Allopusillimonas soli]
MPESAQTPDSTPAPATPAQPARPAQHSYPPLEGRARTFGTIALSAAVFMNVLDSSIANVSLPTIAGDLGVSATQGTWVITSFAVANAITVPLTGWLTQRFGQVRLFVLSVFLFVLSSWLCGFSWSLESLVAFRVLQGAVAGPMIPLSQSLMLGSYPRNKAGMALALWSMTILVGPVVGPLLGGWISDNYTWPWIFYINVPVGLLAGWAAWQIYKERDSARSSLPIDRMGLALLVVWVAALQLMLDKGKELDWFASTEITVLAVVAVVSFVFFLIWELTAEHPVVDLTLFKFRNFTSGVITIAVGYGVFFGTVVLLPLWMQNTLGYTATDAGIASAPVGILAIIISPIVGKLLAKHDPRIIATFAFLVFSLISFMRADFNTDVDIYTIMLPTFIQGAAMATFFIPLTTLTLSGLDPHRIPAAAGLSNFVRLLFGAFGTSITTTLWENRASLHHAHMAEMARPGEPAFDAAMAAMQHRGLGTGQGAAIVNGLINQQAFTLSALDIFYASGVLFLLLIILVWVAKPTPAHGPGDSSAAGAH